MLAQRIDQSIPIYSRIPKTIKYDTLSGVFFYENKIQGYEVFDAIVKSPGFIKADTISEVSYKNGYYVDGWYYVDDMKSKGINIHFDKNSIVAFYDSLHQKSLKDGTYMSETDIMPFCGSYYKKFRMELEVLYVDTISQRVPLFVGCEDNKKAKNDNNGKDNKIQPLPTYIITRIISWNEL